MSSPGVALRCLDVLETAGMLFSYFKKTGNYEEHDNTYVVNRSCQVESNFSFVFFLLYCRG